MEDGQQLTVILSVYKNDTIAGFKQAIDSVINQSKPPSALIITQDGEVSSGLKATIAQYMQDQALRIRLVYTPETLGRGPLLAKAVELSDHDFIAIMDADDQSCFSRFEEQLNIFQSKPEVDVVGSWITETETINGSPKAYAIRSVPQDHADVYRFAKYRNPINQMTVMFKKQAVLDVGNYQQRQLFEDYWLWCRLLAANKKFYNIQKPLVRVNAGMPMFLRRSGTQYIINELAFYKNLYQLKFVTKKEFLVGLIIRMPVRILPKALLACVYRSSLLRPKVVTDLDTLRASQTHRLS